MKKFVITIGRQFGSLGRPIAKRLAELLDVNYYDRDILEQTSKTLGLPVSVLGDQEERAPGFWRMLTPLGSDTMDQQKKVFDVQSQIIAYLASIQSCIIVGRCADYVLKDDESTIHVFIYASDKQRLKNCVETLGMEEGEARRMMASVDRARLNYHKHFAGYAPDDKNHMHIIFNSGLLGVEGTARALAAMICDRFADDEPAPADSSKAEQKTGEQKTGTAAMKQKTGEQKTGTAAMEQKTGEQKTDTAAEQKN